MIEYVTSVKRDVTLGYTVLGCRRLVCLRY
jgi:hypothetical protein